MLYNTLTAVRIIRVSRGRADMTMRQLSTIPARASRTQPPIPDDDFEEEDSYYLRSVCRVALSATRIPRATKLSNEADNVLLSITNHLQNEKFTGCLF